MPSEKLLPEQLELIAALTDSLPVGLWVANASDGSLVYANETFAEIMRMPAIGAQSAGDYAIPYGIFHTNGERYREERLPFSRVVATGEAVTVDDLVIHHGDGTKTHVRAWAKPLRDEHGALKHVMVAFADVTSEREALRRLSEIENKSPMAMAVTEIDGSRVLHVNDAMLAFLGTTRKETVGLSTLDFLEEPTERERIKALLQKDGAVAGEEVWFIASDGQRRLGAVYLQYVDFGGKAAVLTHLLDITEKRETEQMLRRSLDEKRALLREIHHRVKNNLQLVSSLLSLQESAIDDQAVREILAGSRARVGSMALIHEMLYQNGAAPVIRFDHFVQSLIQRLRGALLSDGQPVRITTEQLAPIEMGLDASIHCGLLLNELITNALKHAFTEEGGEIRVGFDGDGQTRRIWVADDGRGLPEAPQGPSGALGLLLVETLTAQLQGTLRKESPTTGGTRVEVEFEIDNTNREGDAHATST